MKNKEPKLKISRISIFEKNNGEYCGKVDLKSKGFTLEIDLEKEFSDEIVNFVLSKTSQKKSFIEKSIIEQIINNL